MSRYNVYLIAFHFALQDNDWFFIDYSFYLLL